MLEAIKEKENIKDRNSFWDQFDYKPLREISKAPLIIDGCMVKEMELLYKGMGVEQPLYRLRLPTDKEYFWEILDVRLCEEQDLSDVMELDREAFPDPWSLESWQRELKMKTPLAIWYVVDVWGHIAGFAGVWVAAGEAQLMKIAVNKEVRNQGVGKLLLDSLVLDSKLESAEIMTLEVRESNITAQKFYEHYGFVSQGIRPGYYADTHEGAVIMKLDYPVEDLAELMRDKGCNEDIPLT